KVGEHGCGMNRSLNIPLTDKFAWNLVLRTVADSSTLKEGFKEEILKSKFASDADTERELRNFRTKSNRLKKEYQQIQSSIADVETNHLLQRYDEEVYARIKSNLDAELRTKRDEIEQNRIRIKEVGNERRWLDWVEKYADRVDSLKDFSKEEKKEYLEGIVRRIDVTLDKKTNDHQLDLTFALPLFGDGIEYQNPKKKGNGYRVIEGSEHASTVISYAEEQEVHKESRRKGRQRQSAERIKKNSDESELTYHLSTSNSNRRIRPTSF
ncbi:MAG: hypothetical protein P8L49_12600, partial [Opitutaceae bacterium]|nr:hypothetical protein [Opitutaceae bacterium]